MYLGGLGGGHTRRHPGVWVTVWKYRTNTVTEWSNTVTEKPLCFEVFPKKDTIMSVTYYLK